MLWGLGVDLHPWDRRGLTIEFVRNVRAPRERVWQYFSDPELMQRWYRMSHIELDLVDGGSFTFALDTRGRADGEDTFVTRGRVNTVVPEYVLALEFRLPASDLVTDLSFQLRDAFPVFDSGYPEETDVWLTHSGFPTTGLGLFEYDGHRRHWRNNLADLAVIVEGRPQRPAPPSLSGLQFVGGVPGVGILVAHVIRGSAGDRAGIVPGDIIVSADGQRFDSLDDYHDWIDFCPAGTVSSVQLQDRVVELRVDDYEESRETFLVRSDEGWASASHL